MQLIKFGYLGRKYAGNTANDAIWILSNTYWNDSGKWIDGAYWLDGIHPTALYYGENIFTYDGYLITYE